MRPPGTSECCALLFVLVILQGAWCMPAAGAPLPEEVAADPDLRLAWQSAVQGLVPGWEALGLLDGVAEVTLDASADPDGVHRLFRVTVPELYLAGTLLGTLRLEIWEPAGSLARLQVEIEGPAARARLQAELSLAVDLVHLTVALVPGALAAELKIEALDLEAFAPALGSLPLRGNLSGSLRLAGDSRAPSLHGELHVEGAVWRRGSLGQLHGTWDHRDRRSTLNVLWGAATDPVAILEAELPLDVDLHHGVTWRDGEQHMLSLVAGVLGPDVLRPFWAAPAGLDYHLGLIVRGAGTLDDFRLAGALEGVVDVGGDRLDIAAGLEIGPDRQQLRVELGAEELALTMDAGIPLVALRRDKARLGDASLEGRLDLDLPTRRIAPFLGAGMGETRGHLRAAVDLSGTMAAPELHGPLSLDGGGGVLMPLGRPLVGVSAEAWIEGRVLEIDEFFALAPPGEICGHGLLRWDPTPAGTDAGPLWGAWSLEGDVSLVMDRFPVVRTELPVSLVSGAVKLALRAGPGLEELDIEITDGRVRFTNDKVPRARAIPTNPAVKIRQWKGERDLGDWSRRRGRFSLSLANPVQVEGPAMGMELGGRIDVERVGPRVYVKGGLAVSPGGTFDLFRNRFDLRAGRLTLGEGHLGRETGPREPRPLEPVLDVVARGEVQGTHVLVRVSGPGTHPDLTLLSSPALPEFQIMTLLILGRVDGLDDRNGEVRRQTAKLVERYHNPDLKRQLFDSLGVDNLGLGFGESAASPILTVGKQVTRQLYIETVYHHNAPPDANNTEARVEYRWTPHWTTDTVFGDRAEGRLGVFWGTTFGGRPSPEAPPEGWGVPSREGPRADRDGDGIPDVFDLCADEAEDLDGLRDEDGCKDPDPPERLPSGLVKLSGAIRRLPFGLNSALPSREVMGFLRRVAWLLEGLPEVRLRIEGHSDGSGLPEARLEISQRRADAVLDALRRAGIPEALMEALGRSDDLPASSEPGLESGDLNRRVEILIEPAPVNE